MIDLEIVSESIFTALAPVLYVFSSHHAEGFAGYGVINVVRVLVACVGGVSGVVFMWWGVRKVVQMIMSAFRSGRISL